MTNNQTKMPWGRFITSLLIAGSIFITIIYINERYNEERVENVESVQDQIARDFLSTELRFELLGSASCDYVSTAPILAEELGLVGSRVRTLESQVGIEDERVRSLRQYYDLLQIKDYLLLKNLSERCDLNPPILVYISSPNCEECERQGYVLERVAREWGDKVRMYWIEEAKDSSALNTLQDLWKTNGTPSVTLVSFDKNTMTINGFTEYDVLEAEIMNYFGLEKEEEILDEEMEPAVSNNESTN